MRWLSNQIKTTAITPVVASRKKIWRALHKCEPPAELVAVWDKNIDRDKVDVRALFMAGWEWDQVALALGHMLELHYQGRWDASPLEAAQDMAESPNPVLEALRLAAKRPK